MTDSTTPVGLPPGFERNGYATATYFYPSDLETMAHLVQFNIYEPSSATNPVTPASIQGTVSKSLSQVGGFIQSAGGATVGDVVSGATTTVGTTGNFLSTNQAIAGSSKISTSIHLYTPEQMTFDFNATWSEVDTAPLLAAGASLAAGPLAAFGMATGSLVGGITGLGAGGAAAAYGGAVSALATDSGKAAAYYYGGYTLNPSIQVLYSGPNLRTFLFDWNFAPRNKAEADAVGNIIKAFRMYSAPDYSSLNLGLFGGLFIPPATFDITFFRNTGSGGSFEENTNLQKISRCACTQVTTNYNPDGHYATLKDGSPVHITLQVAMMELQILTHSLIDQGF